MPFRIALSGLTAASSDLKVTGNNIANAGTTGFKQSRAEFADVFAVSFGGTADTATGNGVRVAKVAQQFTQGSIEFSDKALDLAVSGAGFFVVESDQGRAFTRAGSFHVDSSGTVVNNSNQSLQIFAANRIGSAASQTTFDTGQLSDLTLSTTDGPPQSTSEIVAGMNLNASATPPVTVPFDAADPSSYTSSTSIITYDSQGSEHVASLYYAKTAVPNQWDAYMVLDNYEAEVGAITPTQLTFGADGRLLTPANGVVSYDAITDNNLIAVNPGMIGGFADIQINVDYNNTTQFGSGFAVNTLSQDGFSSGRLSGIDIDSEGIVFARFTNGQSSALGKVALASFPNPQGLRQLGDTSWAQTFESGDLVLGEPGTGSFGLIQSGALEASNVDIAASLVGLITAQRNFQANAQVISTADTVTQTIINI